ncbi:MAG: alanine racemase [Propionibacteriaceae bacterium]|jgi:alanine racemase|nr:alanine racemase [Propionibacteriaceae bacterium]
METYARVDLSALAHNLQSIRDLVKRPILLPVKANAYGHGLVTRIGGQLRAPLVEYVQSQGLVDWLGVATVDEGVALREAGVALPILKLSGASAESVHAAIASGLTLTVGDEREVREAATAADSLGVTADVHLKIDTGMRRIGVAPQEASRLATLIESSPVLSLTGVFTHLAASENPAEDDFTASQLDRFDSAVADVEEELGRIIGLKHAANSGAVLRHPRAWYSMVRPGILSYGYPQGSVEDWAFDGGDLSAFDPEDSVARGRQGTASPLFLPVLSLVSHVSFVKTVHEGETVSYGRTWTAPRDTRVATVPLGYGDGYSRRLSNQAEVLIRGARYAQVGTVCMDQIMVDLGPTSDVAVGEQVTLIGRDGDQHIGADDVGALLGTISYEVLCTIAARVPRVYV